MTGSKMTTMTLEEMRAARERGESQSDWKRVRRMVQDGVEPAEDDATPNAAALMRADLKTRCRGRPVGTDNKVQVSIRYHREVLDYFKAKGNGWQAQMDKVLLDWVRTHSTKES
ncbi:MAG: BrnA antitoxin family protein [Gallionella sp.]|nr:BrnA antitoxin family protein [Gallionella sp.]